MTRIPREISEAIRDLIDDLGGVGNSRYTNAIAWALRTSPVRETIESAIDIKLEE